MAATTYGRQFELMMAEICKEVYLKFTESASDDFDEFTDNFFSVSKDESSIVVDNIEVTHKPIVVKAKSSKTTKGKKDEKKKCKACTAKGAPCSKYAVSDEVFCSLHLKKSAPAPKKKEEEVASTSHSVEVTEKKKKCKACTAKGAPCSKYAVSDEVFCSLHLKKSAPSPKKKEEEETTAEDVTECEDDESDPTYVLEEEDFDE